MADAFLLLCTAAALWSKIYWVKLSAVAAPYNKNTRHTKPSHCLPRCLSWEPAEVRHGFATASLPRSPSAVLLFFLLAATPCFSEKIKKPPPHFSAVAAAVFLDAQLPTQKPPAPLCAPCCCFAALAQPSELLSVL